jgi:hypothetical protein
MNYYYKYIKYKQKYLLIKHIGGSSMDIVEETDQALNDVEVNKLLDNLYLKFTCDSLLEKIDLPITQSTVATEITTQAAASITSAQTPAPENITIRPDTRLITTNSIDGDPSSVNIIIKTDEKRLRVKPSWLNAYEINITPEIIKYATYNNQLSDDEIKGNLLRDDLLINKIMDEFDTIDKDYIDYNTRNYGKLVECWIADNLPCPCCNQLSLRRYKHDNFPAIDVVCINEAHDTRTGVLFFQIKASSGALFMGNSYFDFNENSCQISVGSRKYGECIHSIKYSDNDYKKKILIGYICIEFTEKDDNLKINIKKSFFVLPLLLDSRRLDFAGGSGVVGPISDNDFYYRYLEQYIHNRIECNMQFNKIITIMDYTYTNTEYKLPIKVIPKDYIDKTNWAVLINPIQSMYNS